ncbi:phosphoserine aminotransferase apoenzyme [Nitrosomonas cryotolerans]|uniref:Phosphoserine aminotransferase n=1 Tax=Nitrosomonas cryotolerans ATCC 49181 TaxID=1131553 RepID=A0A1N6HIB6_9PROT|nr:3-phosphoserine/phosphohydroxythreonine transaminase [Nitrosomonas cryotolerans]SFP65408.1 phosphoserine aminotransferase apoenzyme [Nitrosomonas cryotolerans]SIO19476.1 phosphoserine aminotransferase apoenzyme [Nitrosomonas cryotolerans ATCC 49181]
MDHIYNFSAGPAVLPQEVLQQARDELLDWHGCGMSVMEMSHRGKEFMSIAAKAESDLRELAAIPHNYKVLFLQGGASSQFAMVPMNLLRGKKTADYIHTGQWSQKAINEAKKYCTVNIAASSEDANFTYAPAQDKWQLDSNAAYVHYTPNETIGGVEFNWTPKLTHSNNNIPLVADMSSSMFSRPLDVASFGLIYAGAQKNMGPAGLTIVIIREDLLGMPIPGTPTMFDYKVHADHDSMYNTPPTYALYITGLVFEWLKNLGGLAAIEKRNIAKANLLYDLFDTNDFYHCPVTKSDRSHMNVPFTLKNPALDSEFLKQAQAHGLIQLKGHRSVGGMRASIYNAMPIEGVMKLVAFMKEFASNHA